MNDFYFPDAKEWMWNYCIPLGKFEVNASKFDLGVYINPSGEVSHAIVYGNEPGEYLSGEIQLFVERDVCKENIRRYNEYTLKNSSSSK